MIQRIQTVYLFLGALLMAGFFIFDEIWISWAALVGDILPWILLVWGGGTALLGGISIFLYNTRGRQRQLVVIVQWLTLVFIAALYSILVAIDRLAVVLNGQMPTQYIIALLLPVVAYIMFYLGRRGIENDIEKIRSVDRLR